MSKYPIIIFEGIEASGKTTNFKIAANYLKKQRKSFIKLREPGGSIFSEKIRKLILNKKLNLNNKTDLLLFYAGRSENFEKIIKKTILGLKFPIINLLSILINFKSIFIP